RPTPTTLLGDGRDCGPVPPFPPRTYDTLLISARCVPARPVRDVRTRFVRATPARLSTMASPAEQAPRTTVADEAARQEQRDLPAPLLISPKSAKRQGFDFWRTDLKSARYVVAPMVNQSELPWRMLSRRYGAELCYTPMFHARLFAESDRYREEQWSTSPNDRPLIVQFCANDPANLLRAAKLVENECDAVDLNLGCPQHIAKRGHYGAFLMEDLELVARMVKLVHQELSVPITCKIRVFPDEQQTIDYARMLQDAGCQLLTVHGRLRDQKSYHTGLADWRIIKKVKDALSIPVFANGNILHYSDIQRCMDETGCDGVMTAEGNLHNPALFTGKNPPIWEVVEEYMQVCDEIGYTECAVMRAHLFKICRPALLFHPDIRDEFGSADTLPKIRAMMTELPRRLRATWTKAREDAADPSLLCPQPMAPEELDPQRYDPAYGGTYYRYPHWLCQPYVRTADGVNAHRTLSVLEAEQEAAMTEEELADKREIVVRRRMARKEARARSEFASFSFVLLLLSSCRRRNCRMPLGVAATHGRFASDTSFCPSPLAPVLSRSLPLPPYAAQEFKRLRRHDICAKCSSASSPKCPHGACRNCCRTHFADAVGPDGARCE
ncbi:MAG: dihydrouridine synthase-domain-containing protein, partial [Olpidium bornovanus]